MRSIFNDRYAAAAKLRQQHVDIRSKTEKIHEDKAAHILTCLCKHILHIDLQVPIDSVVRHGQSGTYGGLDHRYTMKRRHQHARPSRGLQLQKDVKQGCTRVEEFDDTAGFSDGFQSTLG